MNGIDRQKNGESREKQMFTESLQNSDRDGVITTI